MKFFIIILLLAPSLSIIEEPLSLPSPDFLSHPLGDTPVLPGVWHIGDGIDILSMRQMAPIFSMTYVIYLDLLDN